MRVQQLPTFTAWGAPVLGPLPTGKDAFGAYLDTDGTTAWLFETQSSGFARVDLTTRPPSIIFQGNAFNTPATNVFDQRYDGATMWLQDDAGHYYTQAGGTLYKLHVASSSLAALGNGYLVTDATLAGMPTNITRWFYCKSARNNTRYVITMTGDTPNGVAHVVNADTMTLVGTFSPPNVPDAGMPNVSDTGESVGAYCTPAGDISLWFSNVNISSDNVCNAVWNPLSGVSGGILSATHPEQNFFIIGSLNAGEFGINWIAYDAVHNFVIMGTNTNASNTTSHGFVGTVLAVDMTPLPAVVFNFTQFETFCWSFDAPTSAYEQGVQSGVLAIPGDLSPFTTTAQVGGILTVLNSVDISVRDTYNITQILQDAFLAGTITDPPIADVTFGRGDVSITSLSADGIHATYIANNTFVVGQRVTTVGTAPSTFNVENAVITAASPTTFSIASALVHGATAQTATASVTTAPLANIRYNPTLNSVLVTYEYIGSPAYWIELNPNVATTTTVSFIGPNPTQLGATTTLQATVTPTSGGAPAGTVQFTFNGSNLGAPQTLSGGVATLSFSFLLSSQVGTFPVTAIYTPDGDWSAGTSAAVNITVQKYPTSTSLSSSEAPSFFEDQVNFNMQVTGSGGTPTGTIQLSDTLNGHTTTLANLVLDGTGSALFVTNGLNPGIHTITATYQEDSLHATSNHKLSQQVVDIFTPNAIVPSFGIVATFDPEGDVNLLPSAQMFTVPPSGHAGDSVTLLWSVLNVPVVRITGAGFDTGFLVTGGQGVFVVGNGFPSTIALTLACYDAQHSPILENGNPLVSVVVYTVS